MTQSHHIPPARSESTAVPGNSAALQNTQHRAAPTALEIQAWLVARLSESVGCAPESIDIRAPFSRYGLDSMEAVVLAGDLESWLKLRLDATLVWDYPTIALLADHLEAECSTTHTGRAPEIEEIPAEYYRFDLYPEYRSLRRRIEELEQCGLNNPYFNVHEGVTGNTALVEGRVLINYANYNYLGLSGNPQVSAAARQAIDRYGTSVSASRIASGEKPLHRELERALAGLVGAEDALAYVGGHATNVSTIGHLFRPNDLVLYDAFIHNSALQGMALSGATYLAFPHNDWQTLDTLLSQQRRRYQRVLVVIEGVYSTDGDIPNLPAFIEVKQRHKVFLMVDEAHSIGVLGQHGRGIGEYFGVNAADVDIWMGTLSKAFASCGGYIAGSKALVEYLKYTAPGFVFSAGMTPPNAAAALAAIQVLAREPERVARLQTRAQLFLHLACKGGLNTGLSSGSPVIPIIVGDSMRAIYLAQLLFEQGINVQPMIYPAVANDTARLRFFLSCLHTDEQIRFTIDTVVNAMMKLAQ